MSEKLSFDDKYAKEIIWTDPKGPDTLTFTADDYSLEKRQATIVYKEKMFVQQFHTLIFKIDGQEYKFVRK